MSTNFSTSTAKPSYGIFITVEGIEGVGKSTQVNFIKNLLEKSSVPHLITREPGGTPIAEEIRQVLLAHHTETMVPDAELLLMFASRAQHLAALILPALTAGKLVVSDRFTDATYAYQGGGRGIDKTRIATLEQWVQGSLRPDAVILLDAPVALALRRTKRRKNGPDRFEAEQEDFFERIREGYLARAKADPHRYHVIDASQSIQVVQQRIAAIVEKFISS
jgi:dTMP kinase